MQTSQTGLRELTAGEIDHVSGGWEFGDAMLNLFGELQWYTLDDGGDYSQGWSIENGGWGWGYYVNDALGRVSGLFNF